MICKQDGSAAGLQNRSLSKEPWLHPWYISVSLTQWPCCQWSMWASGSTEGAQDPNTHGLDQTRISGWLGECHPLQIFTPLMKVPGDPYWGGQVSSLRQVGVGCLRTDCHSAILRKGHYMGSVKHGAAGGQGDVQRPHHWPASSTAYHNAYCMCIQTQHRTLFYILTTVTTFEKDALSIS